MVFFIIFLFRGDGFYANISLIFFLLLLKKYTISGLKLFVQNISFFKKAALENILFKLHPDTQFDSCTNLNNITLSLDIGSVLRLTVAC